MLVTKTIRSTLRSCRYTFTFVGTTPVNVMRVYLSRIGARGVLQMRGRRCQCKFEVEGEVCNAFEKKVCFVLVQMSYRIKVI